jgi:hypothetical protein
MTAKTSPPMSIVCLRGIVVSFQKGAEASRHAIEIPGTGTHFAFPPNRDLLDLLPERGEGGLDDDQMPVPLRA